MEILVHLDMENNNKNGFKQARRAAILKRIDVLRLDYKGIYKMVLEKSNDDKTKEQFLLEIAQQANSSKFNLFLLQKSVGKETIDLALELFPQAKI